jgi:hypothetical protein
MTLSQRLRAFCFLNPTFKNSGEEDVAPEFAPSQDATAEKEAVWTLWLISVFSLVALSLKPPWAPPSSLLSRRGRDAAVT